MRINVALKQQSHCDGMVLINVENLAMSGPSNDLIYLEYTFYEIKINSHSTLSRIGLDTILLEIFPLLFKPNRNSTLS